MKFKVEITETLQKVVDVVADNEDTAIDMVRQLYRAEEIILNDSDYVDSEIDIIKIL